MAGVLDDLLFVEGGGETSRKEDGREKHTSKEDKDEVVVEGEANVQ